MRGLCSAVTELELLVADRDADDFIHQASREELLRTNGLFCHVGLSFGIPNRDGNAMVADGMRNPVETISRPLEIGRIHELAKSRSFTGWLIER